MTSGAPGPACVVGAYAMAPADQRGLELLTVLIRLPGVTGFELPLGWLSDVRAESLVRDQPGGGRPTCSRSSVPKPQKPCTTPTSA